MPSVQGIDAFDHGFDVPADYSFVFGTPTAVTSPLYQSRLNSLEINAAGANEGVRKNIDGSPSRGWMGFPFRITNLATPDSNVGHFQIVTANVQARLAIAAATGKFYSYIGGGAASAPGITPLADTWYWIEMIIDASADPHALYYRVNGVDQPVATRTASADTISFAQIVSLTGDSGVDIIIGGYWAWGSAASASDWLGEPSAVGKQSFYGYRRRSYR